MFAFFVFSHYFIIIKSIKEKFSARQSLNCQIMYHKFQNVISNSDTHKFHHSKKIYKHLDDLKKISFFFHIWISIYFQIRSEQKPHYLHRWSNSCIESLYRCDVSSSYGSSQMERYKTSILFAYFPDVSQNEKFGRTEARKMLN